MNSRHVLWSIFAFVCMQGVLTGHLATQDSPSLNAVDRLCSLLMVAQVYVWYRLDAAERGYARTTRMGAAIILITVLGVPYYLVHSRPKGQKAKAIWWFLCAVLLCTLLFVGTALLVENALTDRQMAPLSY